MNRVALSLYAGEAVPNDVLLRDCSLPVADPIAPQVKNVWMYQPTAGEGGGVFPATGHVRVPDAYGPTGVEFTGTEQIPVEADVLLGVGYGENGVEFTGTLAGGSGHKRVRTIA
ncbi:MAG TPA: hypothetical protein VJ553_05415 [Candidatus Paceibacterota bacterium]|nr:hypothetical protein [Candidatus Paceibacterota bacterium]